MPYLITLTNNSTGRSISTTRGNYMQAYRSLSRMAKMLGYPVHSIHGEGIVVAGNRTTKYITWMEKTTLTQ